ncbi:MAG TPA: hypothetical protein VJ779_11265 [Acetobacteraceae bacterium]|nr:hypothetical protein [Acetobacteraceae bacterium]
MKPILAGALLFGLAIAGAGPALAQPPYPPVPPPRTEPIPPPPSARYIWEPGHWQWNGVQYVWVGGHYVPRRPHYGRYVPGHWQWAPRQGRYVWRPAHWA